MTVFALLTCTHGSYTTSYVREFDSRAAAERALVSGVPVDRCRETWRHVTKHAGPIGWATEEFERRYGDIEYTIPHHAILRYRLLSRKQLEEA